MKKFVIFLLIALSNSCENEQSVVTIKLLDENGSLLFSDGSAQIVREPSTGSLMVQVSDKESLRQSTESRIGRVVDVNVEGYGRREFLILEPVIHGLFPLDGFLNEPDVFSDEKKAIDSLILE